LPRGFKRCNEETKKRKESGAYRDRRSFRSLDGHDLLYGVDKALRRESIFMLSPDRHEIPWDEGEWDHVRNEHNNFRRCDCVAGGRWIRPKAHREKHVHPQWTPKSEKWKARAI
jgi:hypothetical protein